jgi:hypothetical protein
MTQMTNTLNINAVETSDCAISNHVLSNFMQDCGVGVRRNFGGVGVSKNIKAPTPTSI